MVLVPVTYEQRLRAHLESIDVRAGNPLRVTDAAGGVTEYEYDAVGRLTKRRDPAGHEFRWTYDAAGQLIEENSGQGTLRYEYDALGNLLSRADLAGQRTRFSYDPRGLLTEIRYPDETVTFAYDIMRRMTESSNPALTERYTYDPLGRLTEVDNVTLRKQVQYTYDARGLRTGLRDPEGRQSRYEYDPLGRLTEFLDPQGGRTRYTFDPLSRITEIKYANDTVTRHTYDAGSRLTGIHAQGPRGDIVRYGYTYDPVHNPLERMEGLHAASRYTYDALDQLIEVEYPLEHILDIRSNQPGYLPPGQRNDLGLSGPPPGGPPGQGNPPGQGTGPPGQGGNPPGQGNGPPGQGGGHPGQGQGPGNNTPPPTEWPEPYLRASYTYDRVGNRLSLAFDQQRTSYSYEGLNRLVRADQVLYSYDVHGNVTEKVDADGRVQYTYDSRQQLTRVDFPDGTSVSYAYDAFGRRVMRDETYWHNNGRLRSDVVHYLYDGLEVLKEYGGTPGEGRPPLAEYWRANGRIVARRLYGNPTRPGPGNDDFLFTRGGLLYYHYDALGTVQALTDRQGDVIAQYYYDVFGQPWTGPLGAYNAHGLTGKEYDPKTGLYYFGARWYDPQVGRWMSQDPARDGLNWYAYVGNSPTAYVDLWGLERIAGENIMGTVVQPGDTLSGIALEFHGDASLAGEIAAYNGIEDPNRIQVGQHILFPPHLNDQLTGWGPNARPDPLGDAAIFIASGAAVTGVKAAAASTPVARAAAGVASAWDRVRAWVSRIGNRAGTTASSPAVQSTGRTVPNSLREQLAMQEVTSNPLQGARVVQGVRLNDPRWSASDGWQKMQRLISTSEGRITIHFNYNSLTNAFADFKFID